MFDFTATFEHGVLNSDVTHFESNVGTKLRYPKAAKAINRLTVMQQLNSELNNK